MKAFGPLAAVVLLAQIPNAPPGDFLSLLQGLLYIAGILFVVVAGVNQIITLIKNVRGRAVTAEGEALVTEKQMEGHVVAITDRLTAHERDDSKNFKEIRQDHRAIMENIQRLALAQERMATEMEGFRRRGRGIHDHEGGK